MNWFEKLEDYQKKYITNHLLNLKYIESIEIAKAGFINIMIDKNYLIAEITNGFKNSFKIDCSEFESKKVIVKGCGQIPLKESLYIAITKKLQNTVSSLMFGEACSAVPVLKNK